MLRHDVQPGKLVAGVALLGAAVVFGGDARGLWSVPWFVMAPIVVGGLCLAGATGTIASAVRYHRRRARTGTPGVQNPSVQGAHIPESPVHARVPGAQAGTDPSGARPRGSGG